MNEDDKVIWLGEVSLTLDTVMSENDDLDQAWADQVMHVAEHVADADAQTLREAFMILTAQRDDGPAKAHMSIVAASAFANKE